MAREIRPDNEFKDKLLKLIPSDIVAAYLVISGLTAGEIVIAGHDCTVYIVWGVFLLLLSLTPVYLLKFQNVRYFPQIVLTMLSFVIWVYSVSKATGPLGAWYNERLAAILLVVWTLVIPLGVKPNPQT
jgi:hypothetical protein